LGKESLNGIEESPRFKEDPMGLGINNDISSLNAWLNLQKTNKDLSKNINNLSSGKSINSAADNPAGLVIFELMNSELGGLETAIGGNERTVNMLQTAEAGLGQMQNLLGKVRQLAVDSANSGLNDQASLDANQAELNELVESINTIATNTQFGSKKLLDGSMSVTPLTDSGAAKAVNVDSMKAVDLGGGAEYSDAAGEQQAVSKFSSLQDLVSSNALASGDADAIAQALATVDQAIEQVSGARGELGSLESDYLNSSIDSMHVAYENLRAGQSVVGDADIMKEMSQLTGNKLKQEVGVAMMAQGRQNAQNMLRLLTKQ